MKNDKEYKVYNCVYINKLRKLNKTKNHPTIAKIQDKSQKPTNYTGANKICDSRGLKIVIKQCSTTTYTLFSHPQNSTIYKKAGKTNKKSPIQEASTPSTDKQNNKTASRSFSV